MKRFRYWMRSIFGYSHTEINGFLILCGIIVMLLLFPLLYPVLFPSKKFDHVTDYQQLDSLVAELERRHREGKRKSRPDSVPGYRKEVTFFDFDPNVINAEEWQSLGLPKYLAERIVKYRGKGGKFRVKSDIKKIYGFPNALYGRLYSHILLPDSVSYITPNRSYSKKTFASTGYSDRPERKRAIVELFDINRADTAQLASVRGIGPSLSRRITKYRDLLGGFSGKHQLYEVYGLDSLVVEELFLKGFLDEDGTIRKLKINQATEKELDAHPYITPRLAKIIVAYRVQHGNFGSAEALAPIKILNEATLRKLAPYLSFE
jgi:DNA uptake protein ComE-like DNA-binding protein